MTEQNGETGQNGAAEFDKELYGGADRFAGYHTSIGVDEEEEEDGPTMAPRCVA